MLQSLEKLNADWLSRDKLLAQILPIIFLLNQNIFIQRESVTLCDMQFVFSVFLPDL
jgi:hypothetical protein